jgi:hypothetical protein
MYPGPEEVCIQYHDEHNYSSLLYGCLSDIGVLMCSGETPLQLSIRFGHHHVARVLRELERSARTKKEAAAKNVTQQGIYHGERMVVLVIEEEERDQTAQRKVLG